MEQIARRFGIDPSEIRRRIIRITPPTSDVLVYFCENLLEREADKISSRLIVLDSLATQFRAEYGANPRTLPERQNKAGRIIEALMQRAQLSNGVAIYSNQVTVDATGYGKPEKHAMGLLVGHKARVRIKMQPANTSPKERVFQIEKAIDLPERRCNLELTREGFIDLLKKRN